MSPTDQLAGRGFAARTVRTSVWLCFAVAILVGGITLVVGVTEIGSGLVNNRTSLTLVGDWRLPAAAEASSSSSRIIDGSFATAHVMVADLPFGISVLAAASALVDVLTRVAIAALIALLCWRLLRGVVFARSLSLVAALAGGALLIGGVFTQGFGSLAAAMAAADLNGQGGRGFWPLAGRLDFTMIVTGLILLLVGLAFEYGERLQRDTAGLV
jgi:hypothetical protein